MRKELEVLNAKEYGGIKAIHSIEHLEVKFFLDSKFSVVVAFCSFFER